MKVTLKQAFSLIDGRLSTKIDDVYEMLNFIYGRRIYTHEIPQAMDLIIEKKPGWFMLGKGIIEGIKLRTGSEDFNDLMKVIDLEFANFNLELERINIPKPKKSDQ